MSSMPQCLPYEAVLTTRPYIAAQFIKDQAEKYMNKVLKQLVQHADQPHGPTGVPRS